MKNLFNFLLLSLCCFQLNAQEILTGVGTKWSDEFREWTIYTDDEEVEGDLIMRWQMKNDWTEWDYRIDEEIGSIRMKWKDDPSQWEIRGNGEIITARMLWKNDVREWRITNNTKSITLKSKWGNNLNEWLLKEDKYGYFEIYTEWENDPREWVIVDELDEDISLPMKMAFIFIAIYHSSPKE